MAILIKDKGNKINKGIEQRDTAVRAGGKDAITLVYQCGKLVLPTISTNLIKDYLNAFKLIINILKPEEDDVVIINSADKLLEAEYGALAAAWTLL